GRSPGVSPLPRRVPQTSLVAELREEPARDRTGDRTEDGDVFEEFTAERAASSLAGFQRGTLRARDDADGPPSRPEETAAAAPTPTPPADRS
ncbi:histidine kinase, partial [Streptomyces sp. NPDC001856]